MDIFLFKKKKKREKVERPKNYIFKPNNNIYDLLRRKEIYIYIVLFILKGFFLMNKELLVTDVFFLKCYK